jgi:hypothetical protein
MRPGLEEMFEEETAPLLDTKRPYAVRMIEWLRLIRVQDGVVRDQTDGSIVSPISPEDIEDAKEYLERLRQLRLTP